VLTLLAYCLFFNGFSLSQVMLQQMKIAYVSWQKIRLILPITEVKLVGNVLSYLVLDALLEA